MASRAWRSTGPATSSPLYQVGFRVLDPAEPPLRLSGLAVEPFSVAQTHSELDLTLEVRELGDEILLDLVYRDLFDRNPDGGDA